MGLLGKGIEAGMDIVSMLIKAGYPESTAKAIVDQDLPTNKVGWTDKRIDDSIRELSSLVGSESKGRIAYVNPKEFVAATHPNPDQIKKEAGLLDLERLKNESGIPFVRVEDGQVVGHEGRHRAMALADEGVSEMPIMVQDATGYSGEANKGSKVSATLGGQQFFDGSVGKDLNIKDSILATPGNKEAIKDSMKGSGVTFGLTGLMGAGALTGSEDADAGALGKAAKGLADVVDGRTFFHNTDAEVSGLLEARPSRTGSGIFGLEKAGANYGANSIPFKVRGKIAGPEVDDNLNSIVKEVTGSNVSDYSSEGLYQHLLGFVPEQEVQAIFKQAGYGARARKSKGVDVIQAFGSDDVIQMDTPSRMARAKEQGFDVDTPLYHGTNENFDEFVKPDINRMAERAEAGFWLTPDKAEASKYGKNLKEIYTKTDKLYPISERDLDFIASSEPIGAWVSARKAEGYEGLKIAEKKADRVMETPYQAEQVVIFDPPNMRSSDAAFDPAKTGSSNLLASNPVATAGAGLLGLGALTGSEDADAGNVPLDKLYDPATISGLLRNTKDIEPMQLQSAWAMPSLASEDAARQITSLLGGDDSTQNRRYQTAKGVLEYSPLAILDALEQGVYERSQGNQAMGALYTGLGALEALPFFKPVAKGVKGLL